MATFGNISAHLHYFKPKPKVLPRVFNGFFRRLVLGQPVLRTVDWAATYACNASCKMCSASKLFNPKRKELTLGQRKIVWQQAKELGVIHTQFTGGEPMTKGIDWICQAIRDLESDKFLVCISTNASLLDKKKLLRLKRAGLDTIQMSTECLDSKIHDELRGLPGNFNHIMKMFRFARDIGLNVSLGSVISPKNLEEVSKLAEFTKKEGVMQAVNLISSPDNWKTDYYSRWNRQYLKMYNQFLKIPHVRNDTFFNFNAQSGCPAGERIYISAYGDVFTCPHVQVSYGNVLEEPLKDIWLRIWKTPPYTQFTKYCRWAFDKDFYEKFIQPFEKLNQRPVSIEAIMGKGYLKKVDKKKLKIERTKITLPKFHF